MTYDPNDITKAHGYEPALKPGQERDPNADLRPTVRAGKHCLNWHTDARGGLVELWRRGWEAGDGGKLFGVPESEVGQVNQVYISETLPGVVKAWHLHPSLQVDRFVVIRGRLLVCTFDLTIIDASVTERVLSWDRPELVIIPPMQAHGWMALGNESAQVLNLVSREYDGTLELRRPAAAGPAAGIEYDWRRNRDG